VSSRSGLQPGDYVRALARLERLCGGPAPQRTGDMAAMIAGGHWPEPARRRRDDDGSEED
jgi:hypothetical protein